MKLFENDPPRTADPAQNADTVSVRFGIPNPRQVQAEIDAICDAHLPDED